MFMSKKESLPGKFYISAVPIMLIAASLIFPGCKSADTIEKKQPANPVLEKIKSDNEAFLQDDPKAEEYFRVIFSSDEYTVKQMKGQETICRTPDPAGDSYIRNELKKLDKITEAREGVLTIWLMPDSGQVMKVRPKRLTFLIEVDQLITEDIRRWSFSFPKKVVEPTVLDIRYRVILQKKQTDEEIINEMQQRMRESH